MNSSQSEGSWFKLCEEHRYCEMPKTTQLYDVKYGRCAECGQWWAWNKVKP
jgi:hypothetical protein